MSLHSLVLCSDEKIVRVLRRVLGDLEINAEYCTEADAAVHKLTRQRFEAVIVDCADPHLSSQVLGSARSAPGNKRAVAVAIVEPTTPLRSAFEMGAHFVLYKPLPTERAKASFRAVRALMKRERRRNTRVAVEIPVTLRIDDGAGQMRALTTDLSEGGISVKLPHRPQNLGALAVYFQLPGTQHTVECIAELAWEGTARQVGIRFADLLPESRGQLKAWLESQSADFEKDDPPIPCKLTDVSPGGCYLGTDSPFPSRTKVTLAFGLGGLQAQAEGVVRVMHPEMGMGVEFARRTARQQEQAHKFIAALNQHTEGRSPQVLVEPQGLESSLPAIHRPGAGQAKDPLLELFREKAELLPEAFLAELRKQRGTRPRSATSVAPA